MSATVSFWQSRLLFLPRKIFFRLTTMAKDPEITTDKATEASGGQKWKFRLAYVSF